MCVCARLFGICGVNACHIMYASIPNKSRSAELYFIVTNESRGGGKGTTPPSLWYFHLQNEAETTKALRIMTTRPNCADLGATDQGSQESHMRSHEVTIHFSPITRDRMEIESREWCRKTLLVKPLRKIRILAYLGHNLALTWPDLRSDLKFAFQGQNTCEPARQGEHYGIIFICISLISKNCQWKPLSVFFHFMT